VEFFHSFCSCGVGCHRYEGKSARLIRELVEYDLHFRDITNLAE
jgi:hypothetical protein